jgi:hypothetical protein
MNLSSFGSPFWGTSVAGTVGPLRSHLLYDSCE